VTTSVLAYIPSPAQGVWHLGPVPLRAYALCIIVGIVAALIIGDRRWVARGGEPGVIYDIALWAVPFGLVGGRLYHVITDWKTYFGDQGAGFVAAFRIWDGGLGIWGAVALGGVGAWIACRSRGIPLPAFGDAIAPGIVLAQAIGRLGNYFNQELYGRPTTLPWGLEIYERRNSAGALDSLNGVSTGQLVDVVHPTFLYELLWNVLVFAVLIWVDRRFKIGHGRLFALYVAGYCVGRFWVELMRSDLATQIAGIRINTFTSTFVFIAAVVYIMVAPKGREDPATLKGTAEGEESALDEIGEELVAVGATSGVVAAAKVAGEEDELGEPVEAKPADDAAALAKEVPVEEPTDESSEPPAEASEAEESEESEESETDDIDDEVDIEGVEATRAESGPMSEQAEELAAEPEREPKEDDESEADESEADEGVDAEAEAVEAAEEAMESEAGEPDEDEDEDEPEEAENEPEAVEAEPEPEAEADEAEGEGEPTDGETPEPEVAKVQEAEVVPEEVAAEAESDAAEPEEGLGSVEGDEVEKAQEDVPEVHEAAVEGAEEAEAVAEEVAAESEPAEAVAAESEPAESEPAEAVAAEAEPDEPEPAETDEPEEGLGSVEGDEVEKAQEVVPEVHEAAVERAEEAEAVAEEVAAESEPAESAESAEAEPAEPVAQPQRARWWRRRG
jgi:prolipoprotein diacylglyceryl transferase